MTRRIVLILSLAALSLGSHAATIENVISPTSVVLTQAGARSVARFDGKPVFYCGLDAFESWAAPLVGQTVGSNPDTGITVSVDAREVSLERLLVSKGWLQPVVLDDDAQAAIVEGRGGWACASATAPFELMHTSVDPKVLAGIALNESGFNGRAWPWTLNVAGQGYFFRSREDAYRVIQSLIAHGRCDFDVGLLQINWCYHARRFASPWEALAPATSIRVAEDILNENYSKTRSVAKAIAYYHSANPVPGNAYLARFARHLNQIQAGL
ncbi:transglycosylase SLT domain-containing protein (plasmid) [Paraburkholderia sprentiae WSM5005]|uniref:Transglycosylase SLT domain-containing protein n=1 Tax=Paraburkholderia sprentiae WSM5005 TaxID=754502 RepID=A0A1I9YU75_9BURK|nr:transglycosylase SLT domain-containing protein [Paraburkholderia sprentiae]APA90441.1 transglycosylase SLT domain-containing protein [Paraburkholderia sprentiae WSM5005]